MNQITRIKLRTFTRIFNSTLVKELYQKTRDAIVLYSLIDDSILVEHTAESELIFSDLKQGEEFISLKSLHLPVEYRGDIHYLPHLSSTSVHTDNSGVFCDELHCKLKSEPENLCLKYGIDPMSECSTCFQLKIHILELLNTHHYVNYTGYTLKYKLI
jgi:hypothetical protein